MSTKGITTSPLIPNSGTDKADRAQRKRDLVLDPAKIRAGANDTAALKGGNYDVNVSSQAREMAQARAKALDIARNTPDVREDKVAELKQRIASGNYQINPEAIADGMMKEAIKDEVALSMHKEAKAVE